MPLSAKQLSFVREYTKDSNATQAAIRAGYSKKTAGPQGSRLLTNVEVCAAISTRTATKAMTADEVLEGLATLAKGAEKDSDRIAAYGLLGKNLRLFTDKLEHSGNVSVNVVDPYALPPGAKK